MNAAQEMAEEVRERILAAAEERFRQFGYGKTTMAEIAGDCGMSAANLYRYFESKLDMAKVLTRRFLAKKEARLRMLPTRRELSAGARLEAFVLEVLHHVYQLWTEHPRINELIESIVLESPSMLQQHTEVMTGIIGDILLQGRDAGELEFEDAERTALVFLAGTKAFSAPFSIPCMEEQSLGEFEQLAREVVRLFLKGLEVR